MRRSVNALQQLASFPVAALGVAVAVLAVTALHRVGVGLTWAVYGAAVVIGLFGVLIDLPSVVRHFSPFQAVPEVPVHDPGPVLVVVATALAVLAVSGTAARRRQRTP